MNKCKYCDQPIEQRPGGRKREYCDDACRQAGHRAHAQEAARLAAETEVQGWGDFLPGTVKQLAGYIVSGSKDTARKLADIILAEQQARIIALEKKVKQKSAYIDAQKTWVYQYEQSDKSLRAQLVQAQDKAKQERYELQSQIALFESRLNAANRSLEQQQAASKGGRALGKRDREELEQARVTLRQLYQERARSSEEIHQWVERCRDFKMHYETAQHKIKELETEREQSRRGSAQVQESYQQYVATTNERIEKMSGELASYHQEQELGLLPENLAKMERMRIEIAELESKLRWEQDANEALARSRNELLVHHKKLQGEQS